MSAAERIEALLRPDGRYTHPDDAWRSLTAQFAECLRALVVTDARHMTGDEMDRTFARLLAGVEWWKTEMVEARDFPQEGVSTLSKAQVRRQLATLDQLVRCAHVAVRPPRAVPGEEWALGCRDWYQGRVGRSAPAAVAGVEQDHGRVHTLWVEVMPGGCGRLSRHPLDALVESPTDTVSLESMRMGWNAAQELSGNRTCDARYRFVEGAFAGHDGPAVPSPTGGSAAGAAARVWSYLLEAGEPFPDRGVVVLAAILRHDDGSYALTGVEGIDRKVAAVAEANEARAHQGPWLDTIIVASERNKRQAQETLNGIPDLVVSVRVVCEHELRRIAPGS